MFLSRLIYWISDSFSDEQFIQFVLKLITRRTSGKPAAGALKLLFSLDALLYQVQGQMAVAYDGGIHTKHRHMKYHDFFTNRINKDDRVIDIGSGIGAVAYDVAEKSGAQVLGIDFNESSIKTARERYKHPHLEFRVGDAFEALPEEKFSVVILSNVLEHLPGRPAFLRRLQETLQPKRMLIRVPLFERDWRVPLKKELGVEWRLDDTHETEYTLESFADEMRAAGLTTHHLEVRWGEIWAEVAHN
ncbi:MAG: class I SAM-dependent methyltransferase [Anaerolineales bacterium]|nr:class I SAM-dependent methyltransferase [Anaerolineales bacterium]